MLILCLLLSFIAELCQSQMMYNRVAAGDPRYYLQRPPVRRSAMEALERLRMPVARYYSQVPAGYPVPSDDMYDLSPQWTDDFAQQPQEAVEYGTDYGNEEYEGAYAPVYRPGPVYFNEGYMQAEPTLEADNQQLNDDFMVNYLLGGAVSDDQQQQQQEPFDLQRRSGARVPVDKNQGVIQLSSVVKSNGSGGSGSTTPAPATLAPTTPAASQVPPQVQMTAVPASPEKKEIQSLVIPEPVAAKPWRPQALTTGQKEEPLFRPFQSSQRTTWDSILARAKNSPQKRPIPLLKKMITGGKDTKKVYDPLMEELRNLKKEKNTK